MAKSRMALLLAAAPAAALAQPPATAEEAMAAGRALVRGTVRADCSRGEAEIVVCGRRDENARHRLPLRIEPPSGDADRAGGEQLTALRTDTGRCTTVGPNPQCTRGLDLIGIGLQILTLAARALKDGD